MDQKYAFNNTLNITLKNEEKEWKIKISVTSNQKKFCITMLKTGKKISKEEHTSSVF